MATPSLATSNVLVQLAGSARVYPPNVELFHSGDPATTVFWIESGEAKLKTMGNSGEAVIIGLRRAGSILGMPAAILSVAHSETAVTSSGVRAREIPARALVDRSTGDPLFGSWLLRSLAQEAANLAAATAVFTGTGIDRLEAFLVRFIAGGAIALHDGALRPTMSLTIEEIAQAVNLGREHAARLLYQLESAGAIRRERGWLVIPRSSDLWSRCAPNSHP